MRALVGGAFLLLTRLGEIGDGKGDPRNSSIEGRVGLSHFETCLSTKARALPTYSEPFCTTLCGEGVFVLWTPKTLYKIKGLRTFRGPCEENRRRSGHT